MKQQVEKEMRKEQENKAIEEYNRVLDQQEEKRLQEWQQKEERIQQLMSKMVDTVKKTNEAERVLEKRVVQY